MTLYEAFTYSMASVYRKGKGGPFPDTEQAYLADFVNSMSQHEFLELLSELLFRSKPGIDFEP